MSPISLPADMEIKGDITSRLRSYFDPGCTQMPPHRNLTGPVERKFVINELNSGETDDCAAKILEEMSTSDAVAEFLTLPLYEEI